MSIRHFWFVAFMLFSYASSSQLNSGLIAHLPMNGTGADISGNGNNALPSGGVTPSPNRHMVLSSATHFNGANESGVLNFATPLFNGRTAFTMSYWFSLNTLSNGMSLVGQDNILETGFYTAPNRIAIFHPNGFLDVMITAPANTWQHLAITTSTTGIAAYLNGVLVGSVNGNYTLGSNTSTTNIGGNVVNQNNNSWLNGRIDDVRFYNRVLTATEIAELAANNGTSVAITSISTTSICAGSDITANYTASGLLFSENEFVLQLSNASGSFAFPIDLARVTSTSSGAITATIPDGTLSGTGYKLRVVSTALDAASAGSADIAITGIIGNIPNPAQFRYIGKVNNKNLYVGLTAQTWANGSAACIANGGRLATISTVEENILIANNLTTTFGFFGLNDGITEGVFLYPNNEPLTYSNWAQGEPNNASNNEDFGEITASGRWNDLGPASTRLPVLQLNTLSPNVSACVGSNLTLTATSIAGATYSWSGPNGHSGSANTTTINAINANSAGTYNVLIQQNGCSVSLPASVSLSAFPIGVGESSALLPSLNNGRVLHYPMNGNANDISGNGFNGTTQGGVTNDINRFDEPSGALRLNGTNGFIDAPDGDYFGSGSFSISAWMRPVAFNSWSRIMDFGIGQGNQNVLIGATNGTTGRAAIQTYNATTPSTVVTAPNAVTLNQWTHVAFVFENGAGRLYVNGVLVNQGPQLFPQSVVRTLCYIGRSNWAADGFLNGTLDDFRIYNRVLSDVELASLVTEQPEPLSIIADGGTLCAGNTVNLRIINSQPGVSYRLRNAQNLAFIGNAQNGTGDTLTFSSGALTTGITFEFVATSLISGCERIIAVPSNVTVLPLPDAPTAINGSVCLSGEVTIGASSPVSNASYNWYLTPTGGTPIAGNNTSAFVTPQLNVSQDYYVSVVNANGCESPRSVVSAVVINPLNPPVDLVSDLILFYRMDGNITDESGNNINGTVLGGPSFYSSDRNGNENAALNIGVGAYVDAGNPAAFNALTNEVTISMWVRQTQSWFGDQTPLMNKWGGTGIYMALDGFNAGNPQNPVRWRINGNNFLTSNTNVPLLQWHHIVCTYNGSQLRVYQNGVLTGTLNQTGNIPGTGNNLQIGRQSNGLGAIDFRGDLDQVRVYARALNQSEISTLFNNESVAFGPQAFCDGQGNVTLSTFDFPGATYQWTGPNGYASNLQNPPVINNAVAGVHDGEYNLEVTVNGCTSDPQPVNVVINEFPDAPTTTDAFVCQSGNATLTAAGALAGGSYRWYTAPSGGSPIANQTGATFTVNNVTATTVYYVSIVNNGCEGPRAPVTVFYFTTLETNLPVIGGNACSSDEFVTIQVSNTQAGTQYQPFLGTTAIGTSQQGPGTLIWNIAVDDLNVGSNTITIQASQPGCGSGNLTSTATVNITAAAIPTITASNGLNLCSGQSTTLNASAGASYLWSTGAQTSSVTVNASGSFSVAVTDANGCVATSSTVNVLVNQTPTPTITPQGNTTFCEGQTVTLVASGGQSYQWSNGSTASSIVVSQSSNITLTAFNGNCSATSAPITITVNPQPTLTLSATDLVLCPGELVTLTSSSNGTVIWLNGVEEGVPFAPTQTTTYNAAAISAQSCSAQGSITITVENVSPPVISASQSVLCEGTGSATLQVPNVYSGYHWSNSNGEIIGATSNSLVVSTADIYTVNVTTANGCSVSNNFIITNSPTPESSFTMSASSICSGAQAVLTATAVDGATYQWLRNGSVVQNGGLTYNASQPGQYTLIVTSSQGCSATSDVQTLTVQSLPQPQISATVTQICPGTNSTITATPIDGATYQWLFNGQQVIDATGISFITTQAGNYQVQATLGCTGISNTVVITSLPLPSGNGNINGSANFCFGDVLEYSISGVNNATSYQWNISPSNAASIGAGQGTNTAIVNTTNQNFTLTVIPSNACGTGAAESISVFGTDEFPCTFEILFAGFPTNICQGATVVFTNYSDANQFGGGVPTWNFGAGATPSTATGNGPHTVTYSTAGAKNVTLSYIDPFSGFVIDALVRNTYIQVSAGDVSTSPIEGLTLLDCATTNGNYSVENTVGSTYQWTVPAGAQILSGQGSAAIVVDFNGAEGNVSVVETSAAGCVGSAQTLAVECTVGVGEELISETGIQIYPNPTRDNIVIEFKNSEGNNELNSRGIRLEVLDISGRIVQTHLITNLRTTLSMANLAQGTYLLKIHTPIIQTFNVVKM